MIGPRRGEAGGVRLALPLIVGGLAAGVWGWTQGPEALTGLGLAAVLVGIVAWRGFGSRGDTEPKPARKDQKPDPQATEATAANQAQERLRRLNEDSPAEPDEADAAPGAASTRADTSKSGRKPRRRRQRDDGGETTADGAAEDPGPGERPVGHRRRENPYG